VTPNDASFRRLRVVGSRAEVEAAAAIGWESGASGFEEVEPREPGDVVSRSELIVYARSETASRVESSLRAWATRYAPTLCLGALEDVIEVDWSARYREQQPVVEVSRRLRIRPPWAPGSPDDIVIEARQAFGTGTHASTALALLALDRHLASQPAARVLDVGCGSGVLAISAARAGATSVFACDTDFQAARETLENALSNRVGRALRIWCGSLASCRLRSVDLVIANLIRREIMPLLPDLAALLANEGWIWLSGLLVQDLAEVEEALSRLGLCIRRRLDREENGDHWVAVGVSR
jgi:ribosomal protein L11 methyltransferase